MEADSYQRQSPRFEPPFTDAFIDYSGKTIRGRVLDSSRSGMAIALADGVTILTKDTEVTVSVGSDSNKVTVGAAKVTRNWPEPNEYKRPDQGGLLDHGKGIALQFSETMSNADAASFLLTGNQQKIRLNAQSEVAAIDIAYLGNYRRDLVECQMKLFILSLTAGVSLAGIYFALTYHSVATHQLANPTLSFWRMMIAALPGGLATACALMVVHKSDSIQRIDSYLLILKKFTIMKQYPREYKGWESAYRKFRHVLNSSMCNKCHIGDRKCGVLKPEEKEILDSRNVLTRPIVGFSHVAMFFNFFIIMALSLLCVIFELFTYQLAVGAYMAITSVITLVIAIVMVGLLTRFYELRKGKSSVEYYRRCWVDLINNCRAQV